MTLRYPHSYFVDTLNMTALYIERYPDATSTNPDTGETVTYPDFTLLVVDSQEELNEYLASGEMNPDYKGPDPEIRRIHTLEELIGLINRLKKASGNHPQFYVDTIS